MDFPLQRFSLAEEQLNPSVKGEPRQLRRKPTATIIWAVHKLGLVALSLIIHFKSEIRMSSYSVTAGDTYMRRPNMLDTNGHCQCMLIFL